MTFNELNDTWTVFETTNNPHVHDCVSLLQDSM